MAPTPEAKATKAKQPYETVKFPTTLPFRPKPASDQSQCDVSEENMPQIGTKVHPEVQQKTREDHQDEKDDEDKEYCWISRREVHNCSSDYYGNHAQERPVQHGEWLTVTDVKEDWVKISKLTKARGKAAVATATTYGKMIKGLMSDLQKRLLPEKAANEETQKVTQTETQTETQNEKKAKPSSSECAIIDTDDESEDVIQPPRQLRPRRPDTPTLGNRIVTQPTATGQADQAGQAQRDIARGIHAARRPNPPQDEAGQRVLITSGLKCTTFHLNLL
ncbi:hypothetical protein F4811DRAFT_115707 [Daldinia bambusicola]|nr:hypothetical protein F4811DRAFT_115707 [Daldinia bambusicola]